MYIMWVFSNSSPMNGWFTIFLIPEAGQKKKTTGVQPTWGLPINIWLRSSSVSQTILGSEKNKKKLILVG